jgi:hypothetical protein
LPSNSKVTIDRGIFYLGLSIYGCYYNIVMLILSNMKKFRDRNPAVRTALIIAGTWLGSNAVTGAFLLPEYVEEVHTGRDDSKLQACASQYPLSTDRAIVFEASEIGEGKEGEAYRKAVGEVEEQVAKYNERSARQTNVFIAASVGLMSAPAILQDEIGRANVGLNDVACSLQGGRVRVLDLPRN